MHASGPRQRSGRAARILVGLGLAAAAVFGALHLLGGDEHPLPGAVGSETAVGTLEALHVAWRSRLGSEPFAAHAGQVRAVAIATDGERCLTGGNDHTARLWDRSGQPLALLRGHRGPVLDVAFAPGGGRLVTASADGTARVWDREGRPLAVLRGHRGGVRRARFDASGRRILTLGRDGSVRLWGGGGESLATLPGPAVADAAFVGDGALVMVRDVRGRARWVDLAGPEPVARGGRSAIDAVRIQGRAAQARALLLGGDGGVEVIGPAGETQTRLVGHGAAVLDAAWSSQAGLFATASLDGTVRLWDAGGAERAVLRGHGHAVATVQFDATGERLVSLGVDGAARLWDASGRPAGTLAGPPLRAVGFVGTGRRLWALPRGGLHVALFERDGALAGRLSTGTAGILDVVVADDGSTLLARGRDLDAHVLVLSGDVLAARLGIEAAAPAPVEVAAGADEGPLPGDFLGVDGCLDCHREAHDLWAASNHARTFEPAGAENLPDVVTAGGEVEHAPGSTEFVPGDGVVMARTLGAGGVPADHPLGWVAGRRRIRMYVTEMPDRRLQVLPAMRAELPDVWFDYTWLLFGDDSQAAPPVVTPDDAAFWTGAVRSWGARCAHCHSSGAQPRAPHLHGPGPRSIGRDLGVDCEACHGPGRQHAEAWARLETEAPLLTLGTLAQEAEVMACTRCHMEGEVLRAGYRLGEDLYESLDPTLLLDPSRVDARGRPRELIYHGLSFSVSRCAQQGKLTCMRCHGAHGGTHPALLGKPPTNHELCADCHAELVRDVAAHSRHDPAGTGATCTGCHMPRLTIERGHGIITDHSFGVPDPEAQGPAYAQDACTWCHQGGLGAPIAVPHLLTPQLQASYRTWWPEARRTQPWMDAIAASRRGAPEADAALTDVLRDPAQPRTVRASAVRLVRRDTPEAAATLLAAAADPDSLVRRSALKALASVRGEKVDATLLAALADSSRAVRFAAARSALEGWERVRANRPLLDAILPVLAEEAGALPNDEMRWFRLGAARDLAGDSAGALAAYEAMLALHPLSGSVEGRVAALRRELGR